MKNLIKITKNITETDIIKRQRLIILYRLKKDMNENNLTKREKRRFIRHYIALSSGKILKKSDSDWIINEYNKKDNINLQKFIEEYVQIHDIKKLTEYSENSKDSYKIFRENQTYYITSDKKNALEIFKITQH